jgi:lipopolysaccharide/colanic/teichoic acid biosynthesis glycosyltransferase
MNSEGRRLAYFLERASARAASDKTTFCVLRAFIPSGADGARGAVDSALARIPHVVFRLDRRRLAIITPGMALDEAKALARHLRAQVRGCRVRARRGDARRTPLRHALSAVARKTGRAGRRAFDLAFSLTALAALSPLLALIALAVRMDSPGRAIFRQTRAGLHGEPFTCYKFRTMRADAEKVLFEDPGMLSRYRSSYKFEDDPRVTRIGAVLRRWSLDELPQLANIVTGDMSVFGPRPLQMEETAKYGFYRPELLSVKPGLTGAWQVCPDKDEMPYGRRIRHELEYVRFRNLAQDAGIFLRTLLRMRQKGGGKA